MVTERPDMDIAAFLTARYDESEKTAAGLRDMVRSLNEINDRRSAATRQGTQVYDAAAWALDRLLADIAAKRGLLEVHGAEDDCVKEVTWPGLRRICWMDAGEPCPSLRWLAAPYVEHPDFDPAWRISD